MDFLLLYWLLLYFLLRWQPLCHGYLLQLLADRDYVVQIPSYACQWEYWLFCQIAWYLGYGYIMLDALPRSSLTWVCVSSLFYHWSGINKVESPFVSGEFGMMILQDYMHGSSNIVGWSLFDIAPWGRLSCLYYMVANVILQLVGLSLQNWAHAIIMNFTSIQAYLL